MAKQIIQTISIESKLLLARLSKAEVGDVIEYAELSKIAGRDVQHAAQGSLRTARNRVLLDDGVVFGTIRMVGIKRLDDDEIVDASIQTVSHVRRSVRRETRRLSVVDYAALDRSKQTEHNTRLTQLGVLSHFTTAVTGNKLRAHVEQASSELSVGRVLEQMKG